MTTSTKNVKLGPCKVYFGGQDMGLTQGGVEVSVSTDTHEVNVDQFGKTKINELIMSRNVMVKCPLAETTLRNMLATMPGASMYSDGVQAFATLTFSANPGATNIVTIGGQAFTFQVAAATTAYQVKILGTQLATVQSFVDIVNRALVYSTAGGQALINAAGGVVATMNAAGTVVTLTAADPGTAGNAVTLVSAGTTPPTASGATLTGGVAETKARVEVKTGIGTDLLSIAKVLRLHPTSKVDTDFSDDFVVYQASTAGALTYAYKVDSERVYSVEFNGYPDASDRLFSVGDLLA